MFCNLNILEPKKENLPKMKKPKKMFTKIIIFYLLYAFLFSILLFAVQKPKENIGGSYENYENSNIINKDRVALVESGKNGALVRLNLFENAKETVDVLYYALMDGKSTEFLLGSILDAADRGVKVRILLDGLFNSTKGKLKETLFGFELHPNIQLKLYEPFKLLSPWTWNNRLHDKIIIVDNTLALIGGRNFGDKYFLEEIENKNFTKDRDVVVFREEISKETPSVIKDMNRYYNNLWNHEYSKLSIKKLKSKQEIIGENANKNLRMKYKKLKNDYFQETISVDWHKKTIPTEGIKFVYNPLGRANQDPWCLRELLTLASQAEDTMFAQSPYIVPSRNMKNKFNKYNINPKNITMLTNSFSSSPNLIAISGYQNNKKKIIDSGIQVYEYQGPDSIHSKTYIFDDYLSVIGSFNLDARSSYINSESMLVISSEEFAFKLKENIKEDLNNSLKVDKDYSYVEDSNIIEGPVPIHKRILIFILSKITFFLEYLI